MELGLVFAEGPIVANITSTSLDFAWKTNLPAQAELQYVESGTKNWTTVRLPSSTAFETTVSHLSPDRIYTYRVRCISTALADTIVSSDFTFRTAPRPNTNASFKFVVYGDSRGGREADVDYRLNGVNYIVLNKLSSLALQNGARFILQTGDLIDGATPDREDGILQYETHKKAIARVNAFIPFYHAVGNHDARTPFARFGRSGFYDPPLPNSAENLWAEMLVLPTNGPQPETEHPPFRENVYSFDYGNVHFVALNTDYFSVRHDTVQYKHEGFMNRIAGRQREWLIDDLTQASDKIKIVYYHAATFPAGGHKGSALDRYPAERDSLWKIFEAYGVSVVFTGHEHNYSRVRVDRDINPAFRKTIYQITTGGAGAPTYAQDFTVPYLKNVVVFRRTYHYLLVTVEGKTLTIEAFDDNNRKFDEVTVFADI
jgi:3',5'-cyclic AMP phosphodiesterase CpdA